jgi:uncharacterized membrane protein YhaH (DUF805 family)
MFTGFEGRINRAKWWIGIIIVVVIAIILSFILNAILGVERLGISQFILFLIVLYPGLALATKRLNDRDRPRFFAYIFYLPSLLMALAGLFGLTMTMVDAGGGVMVPANTTIGWVLSLLSLAVGIWALIELGILKGTEGPNQHGPDPLAGK